MLLLHFHNNVSASIGYHNVYKMLVRSGGKNIVEKMFLQCLHNNVNTENIVKMFSLGCHSTCCSQGWPTMF